MDEKDEEEILIKEFGINSKIWRLIIIEYNFVVKSSFLQ